MNVYSVQNQIQIPVTWNNQPPVGTLYGSASVAKGFSESCPAGTVTLQGGGAGGLTLTNLVQEWANGTAVPAGVAIRAHDEGDINGGKVFKSSDSATDGPMLSVTYNSYPDVPSELSTDLSDSLDVVLHGVYSDAEGGSGYVEFSIRDSVNQLVGTVNGATVASGQDSFHTLSSGYLSSGQDYTWTARAFDGTDYSAASTPQSIYATCPTEFFDHIFWRDLTSQGSQVSWSGGTQGHIRRTGWSIDPCTGGVYGDSRAWATSFLEIATNGDFFEAGMRRNHNKSYSWFVNYSLGTEVTIGTGSLDSKCSGGAIGDFYTFRVRTIGGQGGPYEAHVQCPGGGWQHLATWDGPPNGDDDGKPMVEAGRQGPNTGLSDHHHDLKFRDANNQWYSWAGMECHLDDNSAWNGYKVPGEADHFETRKASGTC